MKIKIMMLIQIKMIQNNSAVIIQKRKNLKIWRKQINKIQIQIKITSKIVKTKKEQDQNKITTETDLVKI